MTFARYSLGSVARTVAQFVTFCGAIRDVVGAFESEVQFVLKIDANWIAFSRRSLFFRS